MIENNMQLPELPTEIICKKMTVIREEFDEYGNKWGLYDEIKQLWVLIEFVPKKLVI